MINGLKTFHARRGIVSSPHALATQSGVAVLREGGNALEAGVAVASTLAVVCPHLCGLGGDSAWLVSGPDKVPFTIDGCGRSAALLAPDLYRKYGLSKVPRHGPLAATTVAGAVSGWQAALHHSRYQWQGRMPLTRLLSDAVYYADTGFVVTPAYRQALTAWLDPLKLQRDFVGVFLPQGELPAPGTLFKQSRLAASLRYLGEAGLWNFYREALAHSIADDLQNAGSPLRFDDLHNHQAGLGAPLHLSCQNGRIYAPDSPAQGLAGLLGLGLFMGWRSTVGTPGSSTYFHILSEAAKTALSRCAAHSLKEAKGLGNGAKDLLDAEALHAGAAGLDPQAASTARQSQTGADEGGAWFGIIDSQGRAVSAMQSLGSPFGSGLLLPGTGICWHNRGAAFTLDAQQPRSLASQRQPLHHLAPVLAVFADGRCLAAGAGGTNNHVLAQTDVLMRVLEYGEDPQAALNAPRCLLNSEHLGLEPGFAVEVGESLQALGHPVEWLEDEQLHSAGQAGLLLQQRNGILCGAADPRGDGSAAGF